MTLRVEHDTHILLRLILSKQGILLECESHRGVEIGDADVEVHHHCLGTVGARPHRWAVVGFPLHLDLLIAGRRTQHRPTIGRGLARPRTLSTHYRSTEKPFVELCKGDRVRSVKGWP